MPISRYMAELRSLIGSRPVLAPGVTAIVRDDAGRVLLQQRRADGRWGLPGGGLEPGEAPAHGLVREVWEETGLHVRPIRLLGVFGGNQNFRITYENDDVVEYTIATFECRVIGGHLQPQDDESLELRWFQPEDVGNYAAPEVAWCALHPEAAPSLFHWDERWLEELGRPATPPA